MNLSVKVKVKHVDVQIKYLCLSYHHSQLLGSCSRVELFKTPWTAARQASLSFAVSRSLPEFVAIELMMPSNHLILCRPLLLPSIFPSIRVFANEPVPHIRRPKYWSFSFCISPSNEYSGLISFRMDWLDLLAVQGTLKSLLQLCRVLVIKSEEGLMMVRHALFCSVRTRHFMM